MFEPEFDLTHRLTAQARASTPDSARDFFPVTPAPYLIEYPVSSAPWRVPPALLSPAPIASVSSLANNAHPRIPEKSAASCPHVRNSEVHMNKRKVGIQRRGLL